MIQRKIYYKSDFRITERSEAGYGVPFRFSYYTSSPRRAWVASFDGTTYTNCHMDDDETLCVAFDDHQMGLGLLMVERRYYLDDEHYQSGVCDEVIAPEAVVIRETDDDTGEVTEANIFLSLQGATTIDAESVVAPYWAKGEKGDDGLSAYEVAVQNGYEGTEAEWLASLKGEKGDTGEQGPQGEPGVSGGLLFPEISFDAETGVLTVSGLEQEVGRIRFDEETAQLIITL